MSFFKSAKKIYQEGIAILQRNNVGEIYALGVVKPKRRTRYVPLVMLASAHSRQRSTNHIFPSTLALVSLSMALLPQQEAEQEDISLIREYSRTYLGDVEIPLEVIQQLLWFQRSLVKTSESAVRIAQKESVLNQKKLHDEVKRSIGRWYCYNLLLDGSKEAYTKFIAPQPKEARLSEDAFKRWSNFLKSQPESVKKALWASCFVAISETAKAQAQKAKPGYVFSPDSEHILTEIFQLCPEIFPVVGVLDKDSQAMCGYLYPEYRHARQLLHAECGENMLAPWRKAIKEELLRESIKSGVLPEKIQDDSLLKTRFKVWVGRWLCNLVGFQSHLHPEGATFFTEHLGGDNGAFTLLVEELEKLFSEDPDYDVLGGYLEKRAENLGFTEKKLPNQLNRLYLAHLGCMMRLYTPADAAKLYEWFSKLPEETQARYAKEYAHERTRVRVNATYRPALIDNLSGLGCDVSETLNIYMAITAAAQKVYEEAIQEGQINPSTPLSFCRIGFKENLEPLVKAYRISAEIPDFAVDKAGNVSYDKATLKAAPVMRV